MSKSKIPADILSDLHTFSEQICKAVIEEEGQQSEIEPKYIMIKKNEEDSEEHFSQEIIPLGSMMNPGTPREMLTQFVLMKKMMFNPFFTCFVSEVFYIVRMPEYAKHFKGAPSEQPDKKECLLFKFSSGKLEAIYGYNIDRTKKPFTFTLIKDMTTSWREKEILEGLKANLDDIL